MSVYSGFDADQLAERVCMNRLDQPCKTIFSMGIPFTVTRRTATYGTISGAPSTPACPRSSARTGSFWTSVIPSRNTLGMPGGALRAISASMECCTR